MSTVRERAFASASRIALLPNPEVYEFASTRETALDVVGVMMVGTLPDTGAIGTLWGIPIVLDDDVTPGEVWVRERR